MQCLTLSRACRTVATATVLLLGVGLVPQIASATGLHGRTTGTESVTAGTWGVHAATTSFTFTSSTDQTVTVTNTGTIALSAESYGVTVSKPSTGAPTFKLYECTTAWSANKCAGGAGTQIGGTLNANSSTTVSISTALAVSAVIYLQWEPTGVTSSTTITLSPQVTSPTQLRAAVKTNQ
jgi:hypothetical protein